MDFFYTTLTTRKYCPLQKRSTWVFHNNYSFKCYTQLKLCCYWLSIHLVYHDVWATRAFITVYLLQGALAKKKINLEITDTLMYMSRGDGRLQRITLRFAVAYNLTKKIQFNKSKQITQARSLLCRQMRETTMQFNRRLCAHWAVCRRERT